MEEALVSLMLADAGIGARLGDRLHWNIYPQGIGSPAARLSRIGGAVGYHMAGSDGLDGAQVQIDVRARAPNGNDAAGYKLASDAAKAVIARLSGYRGEHGGVRFGGIFLTAERSYADKPESQLFHVVSLDFDIWSRTAS
ncbi:MAG: hypothetical protein K0R27_313 [Xanthobacteraceae bacterium]|jgi:hypothetical protein|nr:hypothetical protein [Xanthobacteraceae bacterium]